MPNGHSLPPAVGLRVLRQIVFILPETEVFAESQDKLFKRLQSESIDYREVVERPEARLQAIEVAPHVDVHRICEEYVRDGVARSAEQNRFLHSSRTNDALYDHQWALPRMGTERAWPHARRVINLDAPGQIIAITDSGIQPRHPDLAGHLWTDGAGHHGIDVLDGGFDVSDTEGHGTQLAGTIGAVSNNAIGIAATEWPTRIMAVKFLDARVRPTALWGAVAILTAVAMHARVITAAWGVGIAFAFLREAIRIAAARDVVIVAAAGNEGLDNDVLPTYPAGYQNGALDNCPNLISVMASDRHDDQAGFSNYGRQRVHLAAPGIGVLSTETYFGLPRYRAFTGTSASCAYVSHAAAIIRAMHTNWTAAEVRRHLVASVDRSPWLKCIARGRLSLERAVCGPFRVTAPVANTQWGIGQPGPITWQNSYVTGRPTTDVRILISRDNGVTFVPFGPTHPNNGVFTINNVPGPAAAAVKLRIRSEQGAGLYADSPAFSITP